MAEENKHEIARKVLTNALSSLIDESNSVTEALRITTLRSFNILDTPPEDEYDDIATIAATLIGVPTGVLVFIDEERAWIKSRTAYPSSNERKHSFCNMTIRRTHPLIITDASIDPRVKDNPWVTGEYDTVRFYAGAPLIASNGSALGALCVVDHEPREVTADQVVALATLSRLVIRLLEWRKIATRLSS